MKKLPEIREYQGYKTLIIDEKPFVVLGGEIHNSSASDASYMDAEVWPNLRNMGMNSVIAPIYWECIEPKQDCFDFSTVDFLLKQARRENMKLILLWFGLWKNAESMYVPGWMKRDKDTYFLCKKYNGEGMTTISPFCQVAVERDKNAFCQLMQYLKEQDGEEQTVIMVQVENEIGLLGTERDYCEAAQKLFSEQIPKQVAEAFGRKENPQTEETAEVRGSWQEVFGADAGEYFMAWGFAKAVEEIARAGQKIYGLPMYANAWLEQYPWRAGTYPSGGPIMKMAKMWKLMAPSLFTLAPDIYVPTVPNVMEEYTREDNPLFIPEVRKDAVAAAYAMYAVFGCHGIGFCPFGIEELQMDPAKIERVPMEVLMALNIDPSAFEIEGSAAYLKRSYELITQLLPLYYELRTGAVQAYVRKEPRELGTLLYFKNYDIQVKYGRKESYKPEAGGVVFQTGEDGFIIAGMVSTIEILSKQGSNQKVEIVRLEEGEFIDGTWQRRRILNGDEKMHLGFQDMPGIYRVEVVSYC